MDLCSVATKKFIVIQIDVIIMLHLLGYMMHKETVFAKPHGDLLSMMGNSLHSMSHVPVTPAIDFKLLIA